MFDVNATDRIRISDSAMRQRWLMRHPRHVYSSGPQTRHQSVVTIVGSADPTYRGVTMKRLLAALAQFNNSFPRPGMAPLTLSEPYVLGVDWPKEEWPGSRLPGVYVFLDSDDTVLYIGKASCGHTVGHRLGAYFQRDQNKTGVIAVDPKAELVTHVLVISVPADRAFEAAAAEEFLIREFCPPRNEKGKWQQNIPTATPTDSETGGLSL